MSDNYPTELIKAVERKLQRDKIIRKLDAVQSEIDVEKVRFEQITANLAQETADVEALQKMSLTSIAQTIIGKKAERLEKEQAEQMAAQIKYQTTFHLLEIMQAEKTGLNEELKYYDGADKKLAELLADKPKAANDTLIRHAEMLGESHARLAEIDEALTAGNEAANQFYLAIAFLNDAKKLGVFDLFGGGILASAAKHSNLSEAQKYAEQAQINLQRFNRELHDVDQTAIPDIQLSDRARFADIFFDGLFTDLYAQNRINQSLEELKGAQSAVHHKIDLLNSLRDRESADLEKIESEWRVLSANNHDEQ